jgi:nicotinate phosphoribosyltransferase
LLSYVITLHDHVSIYFTAPDRKPVEAAGDVQPVFRHISARFFDYLKEFRFAGEVWAIPEGTPVFGEEPLVRVTAPIIEAQVVETFLLSSLSFQTMIASKAARVVKAATGRPVVEFGSRRAHGPEAGVLAARAAYIGGCAGTSNVEAGRRFDIPILGTLAHSFVMAYENEAQAFREFQKLFPDHSTLLVDTYDTLAAIDRIIENDLHPAAIRLDSGDLLELSMRARQRLDDAGFKNTKIFASGDLDEYAITELVSQRAPIDAFGVGTALATSKDAPALGGVYKLVDVESDGVASYRAKFSEEKITYPGRKQVFRFHDSDGNLRGDIIACADEQFPYDESLLHCVMRNGRRISSGPDLHTIQHRDPGRNVAVVDGLIVGLVVLAITPLLSLYTIGIQRIYPGQLIWGRSVVRLVFAAFFFCLRPGETPWKPAGHF